MRGYILGNVDDEAVGILQKRLNPVALDYLRDNPEVDFELHFFHRDFSSQSANRWGGNTYRSYVLLLTFDDAQQDMMFRLCTGLYKTDISGVPERLSNCLRNTSTTMKTVLAQPYETSFDLSRAEGRVLHG